MTRKQDPGLWWHRTLQWAVTTMVGILIAIGGYMMTKWDAHIEEFSVAIAKMDGIPNDVKEIRKDVGEIREDVSAIKEWKGQVEGTAWWKRQVGHD